MKLSLSFVTAGLAAFATVQAASLETRWGKGHKSPSKSTKSKNIDTTILNYALTLEYLEKSFYAEALAKFDEQAFEDAGYQPYVRQRIEEVANTEAVHVATLQSVLGKAATKECTYSFPYNTVTEFLGLSAAIEGVGVSAYIGAAPLITSKAYLEVAAQIVTVEARHQAVVSEFLGQDGVAEIFDTPLDFSQVYSIASAFITSCPKSNPSLPVQQFPALTIEEASPMPGDTITFDFTALKSRKCKTNFAHFLNGLQDIVVQLDSDNKVVVPEGLAGRTYVVITNRRALSDANTVAGPTFFEVSQPDATA